MHPLAALVAIIVLFVVPQETTAQTGSAPFCLQTPAGTRCTFGTMGECESARGSTSSGSQCITGTDARGTTGLGEPPADASGRRREPPTPQDREGRGR